MIQNNEIITRLDKLIGQTETGKIKWTKQSAAQFSYVTNDAAIVIQKIPSPAQHYIFQVIQGPPTLVIDTRMRAEMLPQLNKLFEIIESGFDKNALSALDKILQ